MFIKKDILIGERLLDHEKKLKISQFWNGTDFYSTYLTYESTDRKIIGYLISGDDKKHWSCNFLPNKDKSEISIVLSHVVVGKINLLKDEFYNTNGDIVEGGVISYSHMLR
jgi:hypothetical protein